MNSLTGRWVSDDDFFNRERELRILETRVRDGNHILLTGQRRIADTLEILIHDGYLEDSDDGHRFPSRLLKDWWSARFRDHHIPLENRRSDDKSLGDRQ